MWGLPFSGPGRRDSERESASKHRGEFFMSGTDKTEAKKDEMAGKVKKVSGRAVGNESMEAEGRVEESKGDVKQAAEKVKDAFKR